MQLDLIEVVEVEEIEVVLGKEIINLLKINLSNLHFKVYHRVRTEIEVISRRKDLSKKQITIEKE